MSKILDEDVGRGRVSVVWYGVYWALMMLCFCQATALDGGEMIIYNLRESHVACIQ